MSMDPILWAMKDAPIADAEEWAILVCLAERADEDGCSSFPSQATIAKRIKMADRTVRRRLEAMESRGLIRRGDQSAAAYLKDKAPVVWDLLIPLSWFPNLDRIQEFRERKGRGPLSAVERPDISASPDKLRRVDFGVPRPPDWGTVRTSSPGGLSDRADSGTEATGLEVQSDRTSSPTTLKELTLPINPPLVGAETAPTTEIKPKRKRRTEAELNFDRPELGRLCDHLADRVEGHGFTRPVVSQDWLTTARRMLDIDGYTEDQIHRAIEWCQDSEFWYPNVRSMDKLRDQYETLRDRAMSEQRKKAKAKPRPADGNQGHWNDPDASFGMPA